jgi:hypothetical protein
MEAEPVDEPVARLLVAERERVAEETVPLLLAVEIMAPVPVAEARTLEATLEIKLESEADADAADEAEEAREAMTDETEYADADEADADEAADELAAAEPPVRPNWPE